LKPGVLVCTGQGGRPMSVGKGMLLIRRQLDEIWNGVARWVL
jgi:hypothetical protein